ncbi:hypothetical protein [Leptolyngbya sp. 7M]|uniref:hypothetical protein n=1 Tax=Leptolyngbya sp. 7M TaxID=2812896 RepID=UPI001B8D1301|nr:hypothetical protein [Leptolyngbya sp. 7M]QYO62578.1 hypothetical protein JVX88_21270 [Leptolyngbya sp. 7M]
MQNIEDRCFGASFRYGQKGRQLLSRDGCIGIHGSGTVFWTTVGAFKRNTFPHIHR